MPNIPINKSKKNIEDDIIQKIVRHLKRIGKRLKF